MFSHSSNYVSLDSIFKVRAHKEKLAQLDFLYVWCIKKKVFPKGQDAINEVNIV